MTAATLTGATFKEFIRRSDKVLVDFYDGKQRDWGQQKSELAAAMRKVRDFGCEVPFATVDAASEEALAKSYVPSGSFPQLLWFMHGEPTTYHRTLRTAKGIADFVLALDREAIQVVESMEEVSNTFSRAVLAEIPKQSPMYKALEVVAARHMDTLAVTFRESTGTNVTWVEKGVDPAVYTGPADVELLDRWVRSHLVKSEPIPEGSAAVDNGSVVVVGRNFEDVVLRSDKDVFLLVYASWCGFSRKFFPIWDTFARAVSHVPHLVVAKLDGDQNSSPFPEDFSWSAYPTLLYIKSGSRKPVMFHGNRTVANLVQFANEHGSRTFQLDPAATSDPETEL